jgi:succinoglycan biosynthesis transport protein ExoP
MPPQSTASSSEEQSIPTGRLKPLVSLLSHKWLALLIFFLVSSAGVPVALLKGETAYMAMAKILVSPQFIPHLESDKSLELRGIQQYQMYVKQQESNIKHREVLEEALQSPELQTYFPPLPGESRQQRLQRLKEAIDVKSKRGNPFIMATLTGKKKEGLDKILNKIVEIYLKKSQQETIFDSSGRIVFLQQRRKELEELILEKRHRRTQIAEELGVTTFQENSLNPYDDILIKSTSAFTLARRQRVEAQARLSALTQSTINGKTTLDILVSELVANDSVLRSYKTKLIDRRTELLTQTLGLTQKHPSRRRAEQEIAKIDRDIEQDTQELFHEIRNRLLEKNKAEVFQAQRMEQALASEVEEQRKQANHYATLYNEALELNREMDRAHRQLNQINDRIDFLEIESTAPGFVRLDTAAEEPRYPIKGGRKKIVLMFVVAAFGLAIAVPILIDMLDRRLHTPGEVHKLLGFAPMGWVLERDDESTEQLARDYLRRIALALERDWHTYETNCFVLTSVKPGGGTTTLTLELAHILTDLGVRTLAIELNAFQSDSRFYDETASHGLISLLSPEGSGSLPPEMLIVPATSVLPDRLPVGFTEDRHIATHGKLRPLLKQLSADYDVILMDTPPLLLSADAELLGEVAGGVLLVIEAGIVAPGELKRTAHLLERLNPPVLGVIMNRVKVFRGGGYFAQLLKEYETGAKLPRSWIQRLLWH